LKKAAVLTLFLLTLTSMAFAGRAPAVPEIDPGAAASAVALLAGTLVVLRDRRKK
jgi:hypothetical protein